MVRRSVSETIRKNFKRPTFRTLKRRLIGWLDPDSDQKLDRPGHGRAGGSENARLARQRYDALVTSDLERFLTAGDRLRLPAPSMPDISIVIPVLDGAAYVLQCMRSLCREAACSGTPAFEVVLVDNGSTDTQTVTLLQRFDGVRLVRNATNLGFAHACNQGASVARGRAILLLNSDAMVRAGALSAALGTLDHDGRIGAVGGRLVFLSGGLQEAGSVVWSDGTTMGYGRGWLPESGEAMFRRDVDYCSGAFLMTTARVWAELGGLDERYSPAYYEDTDFCLRLWDRGLRVVYEPDAVVDHVHGGSEAQAGDADTFSLCNLPRFRARHAGALRRWHLPPIMENISAARSHRRTLRPSLFVLDTEVPLVALGQGHPRARAILHAAQDAGWAVTMFGLHQLTLDWSQARADLSKDIELIADRSHSRLAELLSQRHGTIDAFLVSRPDNMKLFSDIVRSMQRPPRGARLIYDAEALFAGREIVKASVAGTPFAPELAARMVEDEVALARHADAVLCVSEAEAKEFRQRLSVPVHEVGHAVDVRPNSAAFGDRRGFLFVGRLLDRGSPNFHGLSWYVREVWPLLRRRLRGATLTVAGHLCPEHGELEAEGVQLLGPVADLTDLYQQARVFVAPIRFAAGLPQKIAEAAAAGLPVVATRIMAEQMGWSHGRQIMAADEPELLAQLCTDLHEREAEWLSVQSLAQACLRTDCDPQRFNANVAAILESQLGR